MWLRLRLPALAAIACGVLNGCVNHQRSPGPATISNLTYIDVQPGWRILVVAPLLKSGGYNMQLGATENHSGTMVLKAGKDFEGYDTDYYEARPTDGLLKIRFRFGEVRRNDGSRDKTSHPLVQLFNSSNDKQFVRLLFLTRSSDRDHDQAILTASSPEQLDRLTNEVQSSPVDNCKSQSESGCVWVPAGVAVRPEKKRGREWVPAL